MTKHFVVELIAGAPIRIVKAKSAKSAFKYVAMQAVAVREATPEDLIEAGQNNTPIFAPLDESEQQAA